MSVIVRILKSKILWLLVIVVSVISAGAIAGKKAVSVRVQELKPGELRVIVNATTTSTIKSETEVTLSAQRTGRVVAMPIVEGDIVRKDALIARLDLAEESVQTGNVLAQSKATFEDAEKNLKRLEDLFTKKLIAQQDLDSGRKAYDIAKAQYESAAADATVKGTYAFIRAPFDGIVAKKYTEVGELLLPGKQIAMIVNPNRIYVLSTIDEVDVGRLRIGQPVAITVDAFPGEKFTGKIRRISPIVSGGKLETRTADVWIYFDEKQNRIKPGMSADVEILITTLQQVLSVPSQAVIEREGKKQVYTVSGNPITKGSKATVHLKPIEIGETNWSFTQVLKGLEPGAFVITTPEAEGLKDGATVRVE